VPGTLPAPPGYSAPRRVHAKHWGCAEATGCGRVDGVGYDPRPRSIQAAIQEWAGQSRTHSRRSMRRWRTTGRRPRDQGRPRLAAGQRVSARIRHAPQAARFIEVPRAQQSGDLALRICRAALRADVRRRATLDVAELGPLVQDLDALYINFISGRDDLATAQLLRRGFPGRVCGSAQSSSARNRTACVCRAPCPGTAWFGCFNVCS